MIDRIASRFLVHRIFWTVGLGACQRTNLPNPQFVFCFICPKTGAIEKKYFKSSVTNGFS